MCPLNFRSVVGKKPRWNSAGYWEGKGGRRITWDDRSHGAGIDRGDGPQGGHWDDETSGNRWDKDGKPLPGSPEYDPGSGSSSEMCDDECKKVLVLLGGFLYWVCTALTPIGN